MRIRARTPLLALKIVATVVALAAVPMATPTSFAAPADAFTGIDGAPYAANWQAVTDGAKPYSGIAPDLAVPIPMSDGKMLKADILHPAQNGAPTAGKRPVILQMQGYGKLPFLIGQALLEIPGVEEAVLPWAGSLNVPGLALDGLFDMTRQLGSGALQAAAQDWDLAYSGYTLVQVDLRGTGTSEGAWQVFGERERQDTYEVIDWITRQPWSDGNVGMTGISFTAITALQAADRNPPGLKAVFSYETSGDIFRDIAGPGGAVGVGFLVPWLLGVNASKMIPDISALLTGRFDPAQQLQWLKDRIADPLTLVDKVIDAWTSTSVADLAPGTKDVFDPNSGWRAGLKTDVTKIKTPTFMIGAWFDIFGTTPTDTFNSIPLPEEQKKLIMGDGYHLGSGVGGFGEPGMPPRLDVLQRAWFDKWLKGIDNGIDKYNPLTFKQQGGGWISAPEFPRDEVSYRRMYLNDIPSGTGGGGLNDGGLSAAEKQSGVNDLTVAPGLASVCGRDVARILAGATSIIMACAENSQIWETQGLTFTSNAVDIPTTVSGPINVHLNTVHDALDGYWVATVNDVAPDGSSREISTGQLVASLRQVDEAASQFSANGDYTQPYHSVDVNVREQTIPGVPVTLDIALTPIDAVLQPGHRLRVDVYASNFPKGLPPLPVLIDSGLRPQHLRLDPNAPSWVNIPLNADIPE